LKPDIGRSTGFPWAWGSCCCILTPYTLSSSRKSFLWTSFPWQEWPSLGVAFASGATDARLAASNAVAQESQLMVTGRSRSRENILELLSSSESDTLRCHLNFFYVSGLTIALENLQLLRA
jgi:hypothetical protein